jgi:hypothetical protein
MFTMNTKETEKFNILMHEYQHGGITDETVSELKLSAKERIFFVQQILAHSRTCACH